MERFLEQHMAAAADAMAAALIAEETAAAQQQASVILRTSWPEKALISVVSTTSVRSQGSVLHPVAPYSVHGGPLGHLYGTSFWLGLVGGPWGPPLSPSHGASAGRSLPCVVCLVL